MAVPAQTSEADAWDAVLRQTKLAVESNTDPYAWAFDIRSTLHSSAIAIPSTELAHRLVSHFFWDNYSAAAWKLLHTSLSLDIIPPSLLVALLSAAVVPRRKLYPTAYRLYMELLKQLRDMLEHDVSSPNYEKIMKSIDHVLQLSQVYGQKLWEPGIVLVEFVFSVVWQLLEASLHDEGLLDHTTENKPIWLCRSHDMDIDGHDSVGEKKTKDVEGFQKKNTAMAIEIIAEFLQHKMTSRILSLVHWNMPSYWKSFVHQTQLLVSNSPILRNLRNNTADSLMSLTQNIHAVVSHEFKIKSKVRTEEVICGGSPMSFAAQSSGDSWSALWLPIDLILEDALDGGQVAAFSAIEIITGLVKTLHVVNGTMWHSTFLGLWVAALRLVQRVGTVPTKRERDSKEGPIPRLDTCMCMLLSITTLVVTCIIEEEEGQLIEEAEHSPTTSKGTEKPALGKCRGELITSLQLLGDYESLLTPPQPVLVEANQAAAKAILFLSGNPVGSGYMEYTNGLPIKYSGNLRHLIVEACIARNLLDASAYLWPGYVSECSNQIPCSISNHVPGWSSLMEGSQLTPELVNVLVATPACSLAEIEKIYEIAINGSDEDKISAATIMCGASLGRGWNIQELTLPFITKLLSPIDPPNYSGAESHLISQAAFLNVLLLGISSVDCVHIFSLHGLVPLLAAGLMLISEVFGSRVPDASGTVAAGEKLTHWEVFSNAFTLLLRFWRFDRLPVEQVRSDATAPPFGSLLSPECLLLVRNSKLASLGRTAKDQKMLKRWSNILSFPADPVFMDFFPKLNYWYRKHQESIASTRSGLVPGGPVNRIVDALLSMMFSKVSNGAEPSTSGNNSSSGLALDDALKVPAWDILEAIPFVLDASLTSCAYGKLSTRDLATGLKDLADFLPASLVTIASYFSAEVTRGVWKPALMNGTDWPSPASNLSLVQQEIKNILVDFNVPSLDIDGKSPPTLPLPLAAFVSLTITYKLDKATERFLALIAPTVTALASACPWPSLPIVTSLWIQKVKRWSNYFVLSASSTVFHHNRDSVVQLLKSCFTSTLGLGSACIYDNGGVGALLGHGLVPQISDGISPVAPGILYLRVYRSIGDIALLIEEIVPILMLSVRDIASDLTKGVIRKPKKTKFGIKYGQVSLARSMARVEHAALLGASLVWISGGPKFVQYLISETLPSWFLSASMLEDGGGESGVMVAMLKGYALAFFVFLSIEFSWGIDNSHPPKRLAKVIGLHMEFLESALNRTTSMRCHSATWEAYVSWFVSLMVSRAPSWIQEADEDLLKRLSRGLRCMDEHELALRLLEIGGIRVMGAAAEMIIEFKRI
ncbi:mediator of RNA polymerase II transcription subunit 33B [Vigna angularis]|uniref:mediator of RNA polymerase II transcription subunit 33B n=1 Tax=Phaseolus angularis TaxID=3914 RepID=UPI000809A42A|nr:mediator of RNA polymerase II transcription subunit 33B [Vigna angularis]XP_017418683.1 mediator of RNA polymerase II transcription subunit 33B [Vigna angularis]